MSDDEATSRGDRRPGDPNYVSSTERRFGQIGDFWKRYDRLADQKDKEMSKNLNGNLDVLLILAGLFSAVNTAFISLSMPSLYPDPSEETNRLLRFLVLRIDNQTLTPADLSPPFSPASTSVIANCFLLSSLCFSLLAAAGAMLGKEWLQNYDRTGQSGPLEAQASGRAEDIGGGTSNAPVADKDQMDLPFPSNASSDDILHAQAVSWLLDVTSNIEDQLAVAQNICNLPVKACEILVQDTDVWRRLLLLTKDALQHRQSQPSDMSLRNIAEQFGAALYHLLAGYPRCSDQWEETCRTLPSDLFDSREGSLEALKLIFLPIETEFDFVHFMHGYEFANQDVRLKKAFLHRVMLSTHEVVPWFIIRRLLSSKYDDGILCMSALLVVQQYNDWRCDGSAHQVFCGHQNGPNWSTVLLGAYEGQRVKRTIIDALCVDALAFGSQSWYRESRARTYLAFLRKVQDPVNSNETAAKRLVETLGKMITGVEWTNKRMIGETRLVVEIMWTIKRSLTSRGRILAVPEDTRNALWRGLEYAAKIATTYPYLVEKLEIDDLILNTLDWQGYCRSPTYLPDMENHPCVVTWFVALAGGEHSRSWRRFLSAMWEWLPFGSSLEQVWIDLGLGAQLVAAFRSSENGDDRTLVKLVLTGVARNSVMPERWCQMIVEAGIIPLAVRICSDPDQFGSGSPPKGLHDVIDVVRLIWRDTGRQYHALDDWTSDEMVLAIKQAVSSSPHLWATHNEYYSDLANFVKHIRVQRGSSALIARNFDVAANRERLQPGHPNA